MTNLLRFRTRRSLRIGADDLGAVLDDELAATTWSALCDRAPDPFDGRRLLAWVGGVMALLATTVLVGPLFFDAGLAGFVVLTSLLAAGLFATAVHLRRTGHELSAGLLATVSVALVPLVVHGTTELLGHGGPDPYEDFYRVISSQWVAMELATIVAGVLALRVIDHGLLTLPPAVAVYFLAMDLGEHGFHADHVVLAVTVGVVLGVAMTAVALAYEAADRPAHATWPLLFGLGSLLVGFGALPAGDGLAVLFLVLGAGFIALGGWIRRGIPVTVGALTASSALCYLAWVVFGGSVLFASVVLAVGLALVIGHDRVFRSADRPS